MKFSHSLLVAAMALALVSCGRTSPDASDTTTGNYVAGGAVTPASTPAPNTAVPTPAPTTAPTTNTSSDGCPLYPSRGFYEYYVAGSGQNAAGTTASDIVADHKLRVSIEPKASGSNSAAGGGSGYTKMAVKVTLMKNGSAIASQTIPNPSTYDDPLNDGTSGYALSVPLDQKSNPAMADFSNSISGSGKYSIRVEAVKTNTVCKGQCRPNSPVYSGHCSLSTDYNSYMCQYYKSYGYTWTTDYQTGYLYCCDSTLLQLCNTKNCGVAPALSTESWAMYVRVETDNTSCIK